MHACTRACSTCMFIGVSMEAEATVTDHMTAERESRERERDYAGRPPAAMKQPGAHGKEGRQACGANPESCPLSANPAAADHGRMGSLCSRYASAWCLLAGGCCPWKKAPATAVHFLLPSASSPALRCSAAHAFRSAMCKTPPIAADQAVQIRQGRR